MLDRIHVESSIVEIFKAQSDCILYIWVAKEISPGNSSTQAYIQTDPNLCNSSKGTPISPDSPAIPIQLKKGQSLYGISGDDQALIGISTIYP